MTFNVFAASRGLLSIVFYYNLLIGQRQKMSLIRLFILICPKILLITKYSFTVGHLEEKKGVKNIAIHSRLFYKLHCLTKKVAKLF